MMWCDAAMHCESRCVNALDLQMSRPYGVSNLGHVIIIGRESRQQVLKMRRRLS